MVDVSLTAAPGRPRIDVQLRGLIKRMAMENGLWGAPRIHGELLKLGFTVSERTVSRYQPDPRTRGSQTWRTFLANHVGNLPFASATSSFATSDDDVDGSVSPGRPVAPSRDDPYASDQSAFADWPLYTPIDVSGLACRPDPASLHTHVSVLAGTRRSPRPSNLWWWRTTGASVGHQIPYRPRELTNLSDLRRKPWVAPCSIRSSIIDGEPTRPSLRALKLTSTHRRTRHYSEGTQCRRSPKSNSTYTTAATKLDCLS
jgi:hypothetical protein